MDAGTKKHRAERRRVLKSGKISDARLQASIDCIVRDVSDTGACLIVSSQVDIPNEFDLMI
jgi:hypothetical protein